MDVAFDLDNRIRPFQGIRDGRGVLADRLFRDMFFGDVEAGAIHPLHPGCHMFDSGALPVIDHPPHVDIGDVFAEDGRGLGSDGEGSFAHPDAAGFDDHLNPVDEGK